MELNYCRRCGQKLERINEEELRCTNAHSIFLSPIPGAGIFLVDEDGYVYLTRRGREPDKGKLGMLGGFMQVGETAEQTAMRETEEESGLTPDDYGPLHYLSTSIHPYQYQGEARPVVSINFFAKLHDKNITLTPGDDAAAIEKIHVDEVDPSQMHGTNTDSTTFSDRTRQLIKDLLQQ